jgi:hypothetical protein
MQTDRRLMALESSLKGTEKVLAWLKKRQALGGFADHCRAGKALCLLEDAESAFLFHLINQCNTQVLELNVSPTIRILALYLLRLELSDTIKAHEAEVLCLRPILLAFAVEGLALKGAIQAICRDQTAGNEILFSDMKQQLSETNDNRERLLEIYNAIAPKLRLTPIGPTDLESEISVETSRKKDVLIRLSRAQSMAEFDCRHEAHELLLPLMELRADASNAAL